MPDAIGLIVVDLQTGPLGLASRAGAELAGLPVLAHVAARLARVRPLKAIVLVHPPGQEPEEAAGGRQDQDAGAGFAAEPRRGRRDGGDADRGAEVGAGIVARGAGGDDVL